MTTDKKAHPSRLLVWPRYGTEEFNCLAVGETYPVSDEDRMYVPRSEMEEALKAKDEELARQVKIREVLSAAGVAAMEREEKCMDVRISLQEKLKNAKEERDQALAEAAAFRYFIETVACAEVQPVMRYEYPAQMLDSGYATEAKKLLVKYPPRAAEKAATEKIQFPDGCVPDCCWSERGGFFHDDDCPNRAAEKAIDQGGGE